MLKLQLSATTRPKASKINALFVRPPPMVHTLPQRGSSLDP
jgi:hypothetical protein